MFDEEISLGSVHRAKDLARCLIILELMEIGKSSRIKRTFKKSWILLTISLITWYFDFYLLGFFSLDRVSVKKNKKVKE